MISRVYHGTGEGKLAGELTSWRVSETRRVLSPATFVTSERKLASELASFGKLSVNYKFAVLRGAVFFR